MTNNLAAMNIKDIRAFGVIGTDPFGAEMVRVMKATVNCCPICMAWILIHEPVCPIHRHHESSGSSAAS